MEGASTFAGILDTGKHVVLPALTVAIPGTAGLLRYLRTSMEATFSADYVLAARSMGLGPWKVFRHYVVPNSLGAATSYLGIEFGIVLAGVVVTETLYSWPGMGRLMVQATFARDYPLVLGCAILAGTVVIIGNLLADIVHASIDPRVRHQGRAR
jgi:peptide/nickel transport system permease protein